MKRAREPSFGGWKPVVAEDVAPGLLLDTGRWKISADTVTHGDGAASAGHWPWNEANFPFKVVRLEQTGQEVLARADNFMVARAASTG